MLSSGIVGAITVNATISATPTAYISPYSCEKGVNDYIIVDNAATPNYYDIVGASGTGVTACGQLLNGGPNNAGGVNGQNFTAVMMAALLHGDVVMLGQGVFSFDHTIKLNALAYNTLWIIGHGTGATILSYTGANWAINSTSGGSGNNFKVVFSQLTVQNTAISKGGIALRNYPAEFDDVAVIATGGVASTFGVFLYPIGNGAHTASSQLEVNSYGTCVTLNVDWATFADLATQSCTVKHVEIGGTGDDIQTFHQYFTVAPSSYVVGFDGGSTVIGSWYLENHTNLSTQAFHTGGGGVTIDFGTMQAGGTSFVPNGNIVTNVVLLNYKNAPIGFGMKQLAFPASTVPYTNTNAYPVLLWVNPNGATVSAYNIAHGGTNHNVATAANPPPFLIQPGDSITFTYSVATPIWFMFGEP